jgi:hypothetical protein
MCPFPRIRGRIRHAGKQGRVNQWIPTIAVMGGWVVFGLAHASVSQASFWEGLVIAVLLLAQVAWPPPRPRL